MKKIIMKPRIKKLWMNDLIANPELQGKSALRGLDNKYCCLGRLINLYIAEKGGEWLKLDVCYTFTSDVNIGRYENMNVSVLPEVVLKWAGLDKNPYASRDCFIPAVPIKQMRDCNNKDCLTSINDQGSTFAEIAELIRVNL